VETASSLLYSQNIAIGPRHELDESTPQLRTTFIQNPFQCYDLIYIEVS